MRIQSQQRGSEEKDEREAKEKEDALEISLSSVTEDNDHPEKRQERSRSKRHEPKINSIVHWEVCRDSKPGLQARQ